MLPLKKSLAMVFFAALSCIYTGCDKYDDNRNTQQNTSAEITNGTWQVTSFRQRTEDKTNQFAGYLFTFENNGTVKATKNGVNTSGSWSYSAGTSGYYGTGDTPGRLSMNLGNDDQLKRLNESWLVDNSSTSTQLNLTHPEATEDEHVSFKKQ